MPRARRRKRIESAYSYAGDVPMYNQYGAGGIWGNYISPAIGKAVRYVRQNPGKVALGGALALGALMYSRDKLPNMETVRRAGQYVADNTQKMRETAKDMLWDAKVGLRRGYESMSRDWSYSPEMQDIRDNYRRNPENWLSYDFIDSVYSTGAMTPSSTAPNTKAYNMAYDVGQWMLTPQAQKAKVAAMVAAPIWALGAAELTREKAMKGYRGWQKRRSRRRQD
jgi:hypothetical protein